MHEVQTIVTNVLGLSVGQSVCQSIYHAAQLTRLHVRESFSAGCAKALWSLVAVLESFNFIQVHILLLVAILYFYFTLKSIQTLIHS